MILARATQNQVDRERAFSGQLSWGEDPAELEINASDRRALLQLGGASHKSARPSAKTQRVSRVNWYGMVSALGTLAAVAISTPTFETRKKKPVERSPAQELPESNSENPNPTSRACASKRSACSVDARTPLAPPAPSVVQRSGPPEDKQCGTKGRNDCI